MASTVVRIAVTSSFFLFCINGEETNTLLIRNCLNFFKRCVFLFFTCLYYLFRTVKERITHLLALLLQLTAIFYNIL